MKSFKKNNYWEDILYCTYVYANNWQIQPPPPHHVPTKSLYFFPWPTSLSSPAHLSSFPFPSFPPVPVHSFLTSLPFPYSSLPSQPTPLYPHPFRTPARSPPPRSFPSRCNVYPPAKTPLIRCSIFGLSSPSSSRQSWEHINEHMSVLSLFLYGWEHNNRHMPVLSLFSYGWEHYNR
jgi:hypothetical protein